MNNKLKILRSRLFLTLFGMFVFSSSFGQARIGLKAGTNFASLKGAGPDNSNARIGYYAGGLIQWAFAENLFLQPELLYSVKGHRTPATQTNGAATTSLNYISLPVLIGFRPATKLLLLIGPEAGVLTSAYSKFDGTNYGISNMYRGVDLGADIGLNYGITESLGVDLRYNYGFKGLVKIAYTDQNGNVVRQGRTGANRVFQIGVYYLIFKSCWQ